MNRREFIKRCSVTSIATLFGGCIPRLSYHAAESNYDMIPEFLQQEWGLQIKLGLPGGEEGFTGSEPTIEESRNVLEALLFTAQMYPSWFFADNGLFTICLVKDLQVFTQQRAGSAFNDYPHAMAMDVVGHETLSGFTETGHHETAHVADRTKGGWYDFDNVWNTVHQENDIPVNPYTDFVQANIPKIERPEWFFDYGNSSLNPTEDLASIGAILMMHERHRAALEQIGNAPDGNTERILRAKFQMAKNHYYEWSGGRFDESFWIDICNDQVGWGYY